MRLSASLLLAGLPIALAGCGTSEPRRDASAPDGAPAEDAAIVTDAGSDASAADAAVEADAATPGDDWLVAGARASCVSRGGEAWCWGSLWTGQTELAPLRVPALDGAREVALSWNGACALFGDGRVECAGGAQNGVLGPGTTGLGRREAFAPVDGVSGAVALALGDTFACAVVTDGHVLCWGDDSVGQTGSPIPANASGSAAPQPTPAPVTALDEAIAVTAGQYHACALRRDGDVRCWGYGAWGTLGRGDGGTGGPQPIAADVAGLDDARAIAAAGNTTCALRAEGSVVCWGAALPGVDPSTVDTCVVVVDQACWRAPHLVSELAGALALDVGSGFACTRRETDWACAGDDGAGAAHGDGSPATLVRALAAGARHLCTLDDAGAVRCRGRGDEGELGDGRGTSSTTLVRALLP